MRRFARDRRGATAAEFALVLPLLLIFIFGIIDVGRWMWTANRAAKATQWGARYAVVTDMVASGLANYNFALDADPPLEAGAIITANEFGAVRCSTSTTPSAATCTCAVEPCPANTGTAVNLGAFARVVDRMQRIYGELDPANVGITYSNVELGYAGNPYGSNISPLVTVEIDNVRFQPITTWVLGVDFPLQTFRASMTLEDGSGTESY